jgi:excinuclease ABC subunit A
MLGGLQQTFAIDPDVPFGKLPKKLRDIVLFGARGGGRCRRPAQVACASDPFGADFEGVIPNLRRRFDDGRGRIRRRSSRTARCTVPGVRGARLRLRAAPSASRATACRLRRPCRFGCAAGSSNPQLTT